MSYFQRTGPHTFRPTRHVGGAWKAGEQHISPSLGLLAHVVECDRDARRDDGLVIGRLSYDILGVVPIDDVETSVSVIRPGHTIELVEAVLHHDGRAVVRLRAWLMQTRPTPELEYTGLQTIEPAASMPPWDPTQVWRGDFIASTAIRRREIEPGRATSWVDTPLSLVGDERVSPLARAAGLFDIANGLAVRASPDEIAFPNLDLTAHLFAEPRGGQIGFDTTVSFGANGMGLTASTVYDEVGPIGTVAQILTVRPKGQI